MQWGGGGETKNLVEGGGAGAGYSRGQEGNTSPELQRNHHIGPETGTIFSFSIVKLPETAYLNLNA